SLCLNLYARTGSAPRATLCVTGRLRSARAALRFQRLTTAGGVLSTRTLTAGVHRPDASTLVATLLPRDLALAVGPFRWQVSSSWAGSAGCAAAATPAASTCRDLLPDRGTVAAVLAPPTPLGCDI